LSRQSLPTATGIADQKLEKLGLTSKNTFAELTKNSERRQTSHSKSPTFGATMPTWSNKSLMAFKMLWFVNPPPANDPTTDIITQMANSATRSSEVQQQLQIQLQQMQQAMGVLQTQLTNQSFNQYQPRGRCHFYRYQGHAGDSTYHVGPMEGAAIPVQLARLKLLAIKIAQHFRIKWAGALAIILPDIWGPNLENNQVQLT
jgi:hypothetical protein